MRHRTTALAVAVVLLPVSAAAQPPRDTTATATSSTIEGRVVGLDGAPVPGAVVALRPSATDQAKGRARTTDAQGRFAFERVAAGRHLVTASKAGYLPTGLGARRAGGAARPLEVRDGQRLTLAPIVLARGCAISGRVLDDRGDALQGLLVGVWRVGLVDGRPQLVPVADGNRSDTTDDLGQYRLYGLPPRDYFVSAVRSTPASGPTGTTFALTFFPGTASAADASRVNCALGQEVSSIDFPMTEVATGRVSGSVRQANGALASSGSVTLHARGPTLGVPRSASIARDGTFALSDVVPGDYVIRARVLPADATPATTPTEWAEQAVSVSGDTAGLTLTAGRAASIRGRVVVGEGATRRLLPGQVSIALVSTDPTLAAADTRGTATTVSPQADWTFEILGRPGAWRLEAQAPGWYVKSMRARGVDLSTSVLTLVGRSDITGVDVVLSDRTSTVTGTVRDAGGQALDDYVVVLLPGLEAEKPSIGAPRVVGRPDQAHGHGDRQHGPSGLAVHGGRVRRGRGPLVAPVAVRTDGGGQGGRAVRDHPAAARTLPGDRVGGHRRRRVAGRGVSRTAPCPRDARDDRRGPDGEDRAASGELGPDDGTDQERA